MPSPEGATNPQLREALDTWANEKHHQGFADVMRRACIGVLTLDITASRISDPEQGFQAGDRIVVASQEDSNGKHLLSAYTSHAPLAEARGEAALSFAQPAASVLAQAARDYEGIVIDGGSDGMFIAYADEILNYLADAPEAVGRVGKATATRTLPFAEYLELISAARVFLPLTEHHSEPGETAEYSLQTATSPGEDRYAVIGTSPAEVWAWSPEARIQETKLANVVEQSRRSGLSGVLINPAGPHVAVPLEQLSGIV